MEDSLSMVIIDENAAARKIIVETFMNIQQVRITGEASELGRGYDLVRQLKPTVVIIDLFPSIDLGLKLAEKIVQNVPHTTIFVTSSHADADTILKAMRAGAREFITKPIKPEELLSAVRTVVRLNSRQLQLGGIGGKQVTVFGVRGGSGATTIAANLGVSIARQTGESVVIVDLNQHLGDLALFMDVIPRYTISDIADNLEEIEPSALKNILPRHKSGVSLLTGSATVDDTGPLTRKQFEHILLLLKSQFQHVIIDVNKTFDELTLRALDDADTVLTVLTPELPSISNTIKLLKIFRRLDYADEKVRVVANRFDAADMIPEDELKRSLDRPLWWKIPNQNDGSATRAINKGIPITLMEPKARISQSIAGLTRMLVNHASPQERGHGEPSFGLGLVRQIFTRAGKEQ